MRVREIVLRAITTSYDDPTVSIPSHPARVTRLPMIEASAPPLQIPPLLRPSVSSVASMSEMSLSSATLRRPPFRLSWRSWEKRTP